MAMQTDVKASKPLTSTGAVKDQGNNSLGRVRVKGVYAVCGTAAGSVVLADGSGGNTLFTLDTPAVANCGYVYILLPDQGILADNAVHGTLTNTASVTVFYG